MFRIKHYGCHTLFPSNLYWFRNRFEGNHIFCGHISLGFVFFGSFDVHNLYDIRFLTVLFNRNTSKGHLHRTAPNLIIQLMAVFIQKGDIIR